MEQIEQTAMDDATAELRTVFQHLLPSAGIKPTGYGERGVKRFCMTPGADSSASQTCSTHAELEAMTLVMARLLLRHETSLEGRARSCSYVMFLQKTSQVSIVPTLVAVGQKWHKSKTEQPTSLKHSLRTTLLVAFFVEFGSRVQELIAAPAESPLITEAKKVGILHADGSMGKLHWNGSQLQLVEGVLLKPAETQQTIKELITLLSRPEVVERYAAGIPLDRIDRTRSEKPLPFFLTIGSSTPACQRTHVLLESLEHHSAWLLMAATFRRDYGKRSNLASQLQKMMPTNTPLT